MKKNKIENKSRILWLDVARIVAIVSISFNHAVNRAYATYDNQYDEFLSIPTWSTVFKSIVYIFSIVGVPLFLMISGSLLLKKDIKDSDGVKHFYKNNLLRLFITAEIWYFIFYLFFTLRGLISGQQSLPFFLKELVSTLCFINQTTMNSMWYIPMILCIYTVIPFICIVKDKVSVKNVMLPMAVLYFICFLIPSYNGISAITGQTPLYVEETASICSMFLLYVIIGYWISRGGLKKLNNAVLILGNSSELCTVLCCSVLCLFKACGLSS